MEASSTNGVATTYEVEKASRPASRSSSTTPTPGGTHGATQSQEVPIEELGDVTMKYESSNTPQSDSPSSTPTSEETNNLGSLQGPEAPASASQNTQEPIRILIVGSSGSGKTYTIRNSYHSAKESTDNISYEATKHTEAIYLQFGGQAFELIDTPGFDNVCMSDVNSFIETASYLLNPERIKARITGIIYVHRAGNPLHGRSLLRNFRVLTNIFLGEAGITRLTFLVTQSANHGVDFEGLLGQMAAHGSAFSTVFPVGAQVATFPNRIGLLQLLEYYASQTSIMLPIQLDESYRSYGTLVDRVEKELGYYEYDSVQLLLRDQEQRLRERYERKLGNHNKSEAQLRQQLHQSQLEYSSLRSQLQLQENVEQSQVVQTLKDLNRMIEDAGRSVSAYLTDNYVQPTFGRDADQVTALDSRNLLALTALFYHRDRKSTLIASLTGQGMQIESFLDYSIRSFLCRLLYHKIFRPFHPEISPLLSRSLLASYENIQKRGLQTVAGKWRSETFKSLRANETSDHEATEAEIERQFRWFSEKWLGPLIESVFGKDIPLEDAHNASLRSLIKMAWNWNSYLKSEVILLGDFVQTYFPRSRFNTERMEEFEATTSNSTPTHSLATLALGLVCRRAVGGENPPEETVVCKAVVATRNIFN